MKKIGYGTFALVLLRVPQKALYSTLPLMVYSLFWPTYFYRSFFMDGGAGYFEGDKKIPGGSLLAA